MPEKLKPHQEFFNQHLPRSYRKIKCFSAEEWKRLYNLNIIFCNEEA